MSSYLWSGQPHPKAGVSLKEQHIEEVLSQPPSVGFFEVHAENYMLNPASIENLLTISQSVHISIHGVAMSIAGPDPIDPQHLKRFKALVEDVKPAQVSEHLAWSTAAPVYHNDLLPIPYTPESLTHVCGRIDQIQQSLGRQILIENPSTYLEFTSSTIPESEFLCEIAQRTGCGLLLDLNNIIVAHHNHQCDPLAYLENLPADRIGEIHLAGHSIMKLPTPDDVDLQIHVDDHGSKVGQATWDLYASSLTLFGHTPTLIEWDTNIPPLKTLLAEAHAADTHLASLKISKTEAVSA